MIRPGHPQQSRCHPACSAPGRISPASLGKRLYFRRLLHYVANGYTSLFVRILRYRDIARCVSGRTPEKHWCSRPPMFALPNRFFIPKFAPTNLQVTAKRKCLSLPRGVAQALNLGFILGVQLRRLCVASTAIALRHILPNFLLLTMDPTVLLQAPRFAWASQKR